MDKFLTYEGEQPIWLDDINFMQDSVRTAITNILQIITQRNITECILYGCAITYGQSTISWTSGVVMLSGEILPVKAGRINGTDISNMPIYLSIAEEFDPSGSRTFKDGIVHNCWQKRYATMTTTAVGDNSFNINTIQRFDNLSQEKIRTILSVNIGTRAGTNISLIRPLGGGVYMEGYIKNSQSLTSTVIMSKTDITDSGMTVREGKTYTTMIYQLPGGDLLSIPISISITRENTSYFCQIDMKTGISVGEGYFYTRLNDLSNLLPSPGIPTTPSM